MTKFVAAIALLLLAMIAIADAPSNWGYRDAPADEVVSPPSMAPPDTTGGSSRSFSAAPPTIPHSIDGHQVDINANRCLTCHKRPGESAQNIPAISITHFYDRQGEPSDSVAGSRYFCRTCHVSRHRSELPVGNDFKGSEN